MVFYPIRMRPDYLGCRHEAGHAAVIIDTLGFGFIRRVNRLTVYWDIHRATDRQNLTVLAAGIRATRLFHDGEWHGGKIDIADASEITLRCGDVLAWQTALDVADQIVHRRYDFIDELGNQLEREGEIPGEQVDMLWREIYTIPALRAQFGSRGVNY